MTTTDLKSRVTTALRNPQVWGFFVSVAVMAIVSLAFFAPDNFEGNSLQQHDMQQGAANGEEARAYAEATGEKALWTNALFSGMPTFQIAPDYPSNALFTWLNTVYGLGLPSPSNLLFMMMMGMLILCYCCRLRWWYALLAAVGWGLSSYFVIIIGAGHIWKFLALTYMPPVVGAVILAYRGRYLTGGSLLALFAMLQLNANHPQITYYCGYILAALAVAFLVSDIRNRRIRRWLAASAVCLTAGALAVGANLPALYNTYMYSKETKRAQSELTEPAKATDDNGGERPTGGLPKAEIGGWSNTPSESFSLLVPNIKGGATIRPEQGSNRFLSLSQNPEYQQDYSAQQEDVIGLMDQLSPYFGGKGLTNGPFYLGALLICLFLLGCFIVRGPVKWALLTVSAFSVMLAMGNHFEALTDFMIYNIPLYNKFRAAETALVIIAMCVPLLAAMGLQTFFESDAPLKKHRIALSLAFGIPAVVCLLAWLAPQIFGQPYSADEIEALEGLRAQLASQPPLVAESIENTIQRAGEYRLDMVSADAARSLLVIAVGLIVLLLGAARKVSAMTASLGLLVITLTDLYTVDKRYVSHESFAENSGATTDVLVPDGIDSEILKDKGYYRVADLVDFGGHRRSYFHKMVGGYHAAKLNRYNDLITHRLAAAQAVGEYVPEVYSDSVVALYAAEQPEQAKVMKRLRADYNVLDMLNAKYLITHSGLVVNPRALGPAWLVGNIDYVDGALAEMNALSTLDPAHEAVADRSFADVLGNEAPTLVPGDTITLKSYTPNKIAYDVTTAGGGLAVFSEVWFPWGWHATIDGKEASLGRVNYVLRAMRIPAGKHVVEMTFSPDSLKYTGLIAYASVTVIYLMLLLTIFIALLPGILGLGGKKRTA